MLTLKGTFQLESTHRSCTSPEETPSSKHVMRAKLGETKRARVCRLFTSFFSSLPPTDPLVHDYVSLECLIVQLSLVPRLRYPCHSRTGLRERGVMVLQRESSGPLHLHELRHR